MDIPLNATAVGAVERFRSCGYLFVKTILSAIGITRDQITGITGKCDLRAVRRENRSLLTKTIPLRSTAVGAHPRYHACA